MTKSSDEIMKGLECDPLALIRQLYADNCRLKDELYNAYNVHNEQLVRINQLEAERDAAVDCLKKAANEKGECFGCKWYNGKNCTHPDYKMLCYSHNDKWEWRGVQKEE